jgi:hypothetical protein
MLRRKALELASLNSKLTRSSQTIGSAFRRDAESQYWVQRTSTTQTAVSKGQGMSRHLRYVTGLRGHPVTTTMNVVSLKLDLGQPHQY